MILKGIFQNKKNDEISCPIFIDMIAPKWPRAIHKLARFSLETIVIPMGIGQSIYSPCFAFMP